MVLAFGTMALPFKVDSKVISAILTPKQFGARKSPESLMLDALANPIGCKALEEIVRPTQRVTIILPDKTRQCGASVFLPLIVEKLNAA
ncbi:MAG: lactate racemase domain-containing protein, partial [bacterium]